MSAVLKSTSCYRSVLKQQQQQREQTYMWAWPADLSTRELTSPVRVPEWPLYVSLGLQLFLILMDTGSQFQQVARTQRLWWLSWIRSHLNIYGLGQSVPFTRPTISNFFRRASISCSLSCAMLLAHLKAGFGLAPMIFFWQYSSFQDSPWQCDLFCYMHSILFHHSGWACYFVWEEI